MATEYFTAFLSSSEMEQMFQAVFGSLLTPRGYQYVGKCRWANDSGAGFKRLFYLYPYRPGEAYYPYAAISFDYVPRLESGTVKIRSGSKHTRIHLSIAGVCFDKSREIGRNRTTALRKCLDISEDVVDSFTNLLASFRTLDDTLTSFRQKKVDDIRGFYNFPETALAFAFTLAAAGNLPEAKSEIDIVLASNSFPIETHETIRSMLNSLGASKIVH